MVGKTEENGPCDEPVSHSRTKAAVLRCLDAILPLSVDKNRRGWVVSMKMTPLITLMKLAVAKRHTFSTLGAYF